MKNVLILGARGRFASAALKAFVADGWQVTALTRPGRQPQPQAGVRWLAMDLQDSQGIASAAGSIDLVVHGLSPRYTDADWKQHALPMLEASIRITAALGCALMLPGTVYNYGSQLTPQLTPEQGFQPDHYKAQVRVHMEHALKVAVQKGQIRQAIVLRAGDFFGADSGTWLDQAIAKTLHGGVMQWPGPQDVATPWAYLPDLATTAVRVANKRDQLPAFSRLHFAGHQQTGADWAKVLQAIAQQQGWLAPGQAITVKRLPWSILRVVGWFKPEVASLVKINYLWRTPHALDNRSLEALIGPEPHTPFPQAVAQALQQAGLLTAQTGRAAIAA